MLSRVSLGGPGGIAGSTAVASPDGGVEVLDDPATAKVSSPCAEGVDSELSALPLTSAPNAGTEELEEKGRSSPPTVITYRKFPARSDSPGGPLPAGGGVRSALGDPGRSGSVCERRHGGHSRGGVGLGDGDLLGLARLLSTVGTEALTFQH